MNLNKEKEELYSRNFTRFGLDLNVFISVVLAFNIFTILNPNASAKFIAYTINKNFNWFFIFIMNAFLFFIKFSKFGKIRLRNYTAKPELNDIPTIKILNSNINMARLRKR